MAVPGTMGRILMVDLDDRQITIAQPSDELYRTYLGGYGMGAYYLYRLQKRGVDPLGPGNLLGVFTGLLTGTAAIAGNRYFVVGKSPKTGTWGDASSGGTFGPGFKAAGFDGAIFKGISSKPVYLLIEDGEARLESANEWWGLDAIETEHAVREVYGKKTAVACIGPAGERKALLGCVINDKGRAAGRGGLGAVMGSKRLKAIVALGSQPVTMADPEGMKEAIAKYREFMREQGMKVLNPCGTAGTTVGACAMGDAPIKNWAGTPGDFPTAGKITDDSLMAILRRKYACWRCPIDCGGETEVDEGRHASRGHKPEYDTLGAFGTLCLNDDVDSINLCNEICSRAGLDATSTGCTVAFAIECYENGLITDADTDGIRLNWGNADGIVAITRAIAEGTGFGKILADGVKRAAERIGKGADAFAIHIQGEEIPLHDPRLNPGLATSYKMDATPGRPIQASVWMAEASDKDKDQGKGRIHRTISNACHVSTSAGMCMFGWICLPPEALLDALYHTTGHKYTYEEIDRMGARIATLQIAFNLREGIRNIDFAVPDRILGRPPLESGPLAGVTVDIDTQVRDYLEAMGWDPKTGVPKPETLKDLGLEFVAADLQG